MANFYGTGKAVLVNVIVDGQIETLHVDLQNYPELTLDMLSKMSDDEAISYFSKQNLTDEEIEINDAVKAFESGIGADVFTRIQDAYFHKEVDGISLPKDLFTSMIDALKNEDEEKYNSLLLFWKWCALNDNPESRQSLFNYLSVNGFTLTDTGLFQTYRQVVDVKTSIRGNFYPKLFTFVQGAWEKVRQTWKESPAKNYIKAIPTGDDRFEYSITKVKDGGDGVILGTLADVYELCKTNTVFTDAKTGTFEIVMFEPVEEVRKDCDFNHNKDCSRGLHVGTPAFVKNTNFGGVGIVVLINPKDVVSVPYSDCHKMRVNKYLPIDYIKWDKDGNIVQADYSLVNDTYSNESIEDLDDKLKGLTLEEMLTHRLIPTDVTPNVFKQLKTDLANIQNSLKGRTVQL